MGVLPESTRLPSPTYALLVASTSPELSSNRPRAPRGHKVLYSRNVDDRSSKAHTAVGLLAFVLANIKLFAIYGEACDRRQLSLRYVSIRSNLERLQLSPLQRGISPPCLHLHSFRTPSTCTTITLSHIIATTLRRPCTPRVGRHVQLPQ